MSQADPDASFEPFPMPEIDANGVDRDQIRRLLELTAEQRLAAHDAFMNAAFEIWRRNGREGLR
jgi:hypothetical protein